MCCFFNKAYLRVPFDIIKQYKVILLYHCWNHVVFSFIVVKDAASHSTNYSLPPPHPVFLLEVQYSILKSLISTCVLSYVGSREDWLLDRICESKKDCWDSIRRTSYPYQ